VELARRTVLLTGAAGGIGVATARRLAAAGSRLALVDIDRDRLEALREEIGEGAIALPADMTDLRQMDDAVAATRDRFGSLSVVVANAAMDAIAPISEIEPAVFDRVVEVNLMGTFRTVRAALAAVRDERGHVLIINSARSSRRRSRRRMPRARRALRPSPTVFIKSCAVRAPRLASSTSGRSTPSTSAPAWRTR